MHLVIFPPGAISLSADDWDAINDVPPGEVRVIATDHTCYGQSSSRLVMDMMRSITLMISVAAVNHLGKFKGAVHVGI